MGKRIPNGRFDLYSSLSVRQIINAVNMMTLQQLTGLVIHIDEMRSKGHVMSSVDMKVYKAAKTRIELLRSIDDTMDNVFDV